MFHVLRMFLSDEGPTLETLDFGILCCTVRYFTNGTLVVIYTI